METEQNLKSWTATSAAVILTGISDSLTPRDINSSLSQKTFGPTAD